MLCRKHACLRGIAFMNPLNMTIAALDRPTFKQGGHGVTPSSKQSSQTQRNKGHSTFAMNVFQRKHVHPSVPRKVMPLVLLDDHTR